MAAKLRSRLLVPHQRDSAIGHEASAAINDVFQGRVILDLKDKKFESRSRIPFGKIGGTPGRTGARRRVRVAEP